MKKWIKYTGICGVLLVAALMLCSCKQLDEMRRDHAVYTEKGNKKTVEFRGETYELVNRETVNGNLKEGYSLIVDNFESGRLTQPDVPVLLSTVEGESFEFPGNVEEAPMFFFVPGTGEDNRGSRFYCTAGGLDTFRELVENADMDHFYVTQYGWVEDDHTYHAGQKLLDQTVTDAILQALNRPFDNNTDVKQYSKIVDLSRKLLEFSFCDQNVLFTNGKHVQILRTKGDNRSYYVAASPETVINDQYDDLGGLYGVEWKRVADKDAPLLEKLYQTFPDEVQMMADPEEYEDE